LLLVDKFDNITGNLDKKTAHLNDYIFSEKAQPHRAFSIFLFNEQN
jgi:isopentenyldiphosphate isomerase